MQGLVGIVLLLCCVNVSGLMLSKLHERQHEFAVRTAIGAGRTRLMRQYLTESFVIALAGSALGAAVAWYGSAPAAAVLPRSDQLIGMDIQPDRTVFFVTAGLAVFTTLFFGLAPAWRAGRTNPGSLLKARAAAQRQLTGRGFVAIQVGLSLVLVVLATLLSQSLGKLRGEPTGFDVEHVTIQTPPFSILPQKGRRQARSLSADGRSHRAGAGRRVRGGHLVYADDRLPGRSAKFQAQADGRRGRRGPHARLQPRRPRLLPHDEDVDSRGP